LGTGETKQRKKESNYGLHERRASKNLADVSRSKAQIALFVSAQPYEPNQRLHCEAADQVALLFAFTMQRAT